MSRRVRRRRRLVFGFLVDAAAPALVFALIWIAFSLGEMASQVRPQPAVHVLAGGRS